ncbi:ABC transporter permease [Streptomyces noursei]|uniref:ABC transporter permease n=1 Tax=Streptomyces noursei TaxID=1971 RepID=A0A2N8PFV4_STRNR|nr:FtsX-like permease family protein [Streptomyces noursei]PNE39907.1 hypothetical protein AOB60_02030 [Streptomyces noursei]
MFRIAVRNVLAHRARLLMTLLSVILGTAFLSGTLVFTDSVTCAVRDSSARNYQDVTVMARARPTGPGLRQADVDKLARLPGAASVRPAVEGFTAVADPDGKALADRQSSALGADYHTNDPRYTLTAGRAPARSGEVAIDERTAERARVHLGDTLRTATDGPVRAQTVVGIVTSQDPRVTTGGSLVLYDTVTAQRLLTPHGHYNEIAVSATPSTHPNDLKRQVRETLPEQAVTVSSGSDLAAQQAEQIGRATSILTKSLLIFAAIALFVSTFLIANTFTMLIAQRTREIALLRTVGASRKQISLGLLAEATVIGLVATTSGLLLGTGIGAATRAILNRTGAGFPDGPLVLTTATIATTFAIGLGVTLLSAWLPVRRAATIPPITALTAIQFPSDTAASHRRILAGALLTACGIAAMGWVTTFHDSTGLPPALLGAALLMTGVILLAPLLTLPFTHLVLRPSTRLFRTPGTLAVRNAQRHPRRTAATVSALTVALALLTGLTVIGHSARLGIDKATQAQFAADLRISPAGGGTSLDPKLADAVAQVRGVAFSSPVRSTLVTFDQGTASLYGADTGCIDKLTNLHMSTGSLPIPGRHQLAVSQDGAHRYGWQVGQAVTLHGTTETSASFTVTGIYHTARGIGDALTDTAALAPLSAAVRDHNVLVKAAPGTATHTLSERLRHALGDNPILRVQDRKSVETDAAGILATILQLLYGLLATSLAIALIGIANTLGLSVRERTREIGVLRAIGLPRKSLRAMIRIESALLTLFGALLGTSLGIFLAATGAPLLATSFPEYATEIPWDTLALGLAATVTVGALIATLPARRAALTSPLEAIRSE